MTAVLTQTPFDLLLLPAPEEQQALDLAQRPPGRKKPKINRKRDPAASLPYDRCQTPPTAVHPLLPYLPTGAVIWECAAGDGYLADELERQGYVVERSDILTGQNFYTYEPPHWDILLTNPPFSDVRAWLRRCYALGKPFALLIPAEAWHNSGAHRIFHEFNVLPEILSLGKRVNFLMPLKRSWSGSSAQFPVVWLCHNLLPQLIVLGRLPKLEEIYQERLL